MFNKYIANYIILININIIYSCKHNQIIKLNFNLFLLFNAELIRFYSEIYGEVKF